MQLDNPRMIQQARDMGVSEAEPLYWSIEDALMKDSNRAMGLLTIMWYLAKYNPVTIKDGLRAAYRRRLQEITYEVMGEPIPKFYRPIDICSEINARELSFKKEKDLREHLSANPRILEKALGCSLRVMGTEVETDFDYRCDIVVMSKSLFFPIELKIVQATHQVVSQILKYCFYFYRQLRYSFYMDIQGVVCSNGLDHWSINELRRLGIWCFNIRESGTEVILDRI